MSSRNTVRFALAAVLGFAVASPAAAATKWVMASGYPEASFFTKNLRMFIEEIETATNGELTIDLRPNGELIKLDAIKRSVQSGQIPIGEIRFGVYGNEDPMFTLDSVPEIAGNYDAAWRLMEAQAPYFDKVLGEAGIAVLAYEAWPGQGFYTKFEVESADQFDGVKLRIYSEATQRMGELLGFQATILPFAEVPQAFSTGLIDAMFTSAQTGNDVQAWDFIDHFTYTGTMHNKNGIIVNKRALAKLDPAVRDAVVAAGENATRRAWELSKEASEITLENLRKAGMKVAEASPALQARLDEVGAEMVKEWSAKATPEQQAVIDAYLKSAD
ncbi:TRAP transporter substrate-binding protein [Pikeienuella sp. HZG-20]|uniref:TRAP transporter substrate-binding protein n=1 Tax=Paludibacillus litoralis TaxID=3133267 RepID=UPI0030EC2925